MPNGAAAQAEGFLLILHGLQNGTMRHLGAAQRLNEWFRCHLEVFPRVSPSTGRILEKPWLC